MDALIKRNFNIVAVVTSTDKPSGRNSQTQYSAVKEYTLNTGIPILQPRSMKSPEFIEELKALNADIFVVVAFRMMPEIVWNMPSMGTINLHGSLLPKYRGAAPINWAIINGEKVTGNTTFKLKHEIDTGDILLQGRVPILDKDNAGTLHDKMMYHGAEVLVDTLLGLFSGELKERPQKDIDITYAPKLFKENTQIDWNQTVFNLNNFIRGLSPYPSAHTVLGNKFLKILASHSVEVQHNLPTCTMESDNKTYLRYAGLDGWVYIDELQLEGKKRMAISDFLNGFKIN